MQQFENRFQLLVQFFEGFASFRVLAGVMITQDDLAASFSGINWRGVCEFRATHCKTANINENTAMMKSRMVAIKNLCKLLKYTERITNVSDSSSSSDLLF